MSFSKPCGREGCSARVVVKHKYLLNIQKYHSQECANIMRKLYRHTEEAKLTISKKSKGKNHTKIWNDNISKGLLSSGHTTKGRKRPPEELERMSKSLKGRGGKYIRTPEILERMSSKLRGRTYTEESNRRRSETLKRKIASGEIIRHPENPSKTEIYWGKRIEEIFKIQLVRSKWIKNRCFDYRYKKYLFEIDGSYWHSLPDRIEVDTLKNDLAYQYNYILYRFSVDSFQDVEKCITDNFSLFSNIFTDTAA